MTPEARWKVSLSNGETLYEEKGNFKSSKEERFSPWKRLILYIEELNENSEKPIEITSIGIYTDDGRTFNLPSGGRVPKFHAFFTAKKPRAFNMFKASSSGISMRRGANREEYNFIVAEAIYDIGRLQMWVEINEGKNCWTLFVPENGENSV